MSRIIEILRDSNYKLALFSQKEIDALENRIIEKTDKDKVSYSINCLIRNKPLQLKPEEIVRQLYLAQLINKYNYPKDRIQVEYPVNFGSDSSKRADIVVFAKDTTNVYILVELKKPQAKEGKEQLKSYCNAKGAPIGVWTNGEEINYYNRQEPNIFNEIRDIPSVTQTLSDILNIRFTILELISDDKLKGKTLKRIIEEFEDEVLANAGVDVFEEAFKLIFTKLYDEFLSGTDKNNLFRWLEDNPEVQIDPLEKWIAQFEKERKEKERTGTTVVMALDETGKLCRKFYTNRYTKFRNMEFRNTSVEEDTKKQIESLFEAAKKKWKGIFPDDAKIQLPPAHLQTCVSYLQEVKLFNSNLEIVDEAFEYLVNKDAKGDKGQYFTPRYIIDMCVKMLNPQYDELMIDTAAGSCGFPVHTIFYVWEQLNPGGNNSFSTAEKTPEQIKYVQENVFAIDFDLKAVRVGRTLNLIAGDGETNVLELNSLDFERWEQDYPAKPYWKKYFQKGFDNLLDQRTDKDSNKHFGFDLIMANPPFAGDIKDKRLLLKYELSRKTAEETDKTTGEKLTKDKGWHEKISRDILFIERNIDMLKDGGRMAIVLPQGRFNNQSDKYIRQYITDRCRILSVVGLHGNSFKPHTGTKTSVLFVQKWDAVLCPKVDNYNIFFATQRKSGKDNSGEKLYEKRPYVNHYLLNKGTTEVPLSIFKEKYGDPDTYNRYQLGKDGKIVTWEELSKLSTQHQKKYVPIQSAYVFDKIMKDRYGHAVVEHDLFRTELQDNLETNKGIAEAFIEFAKKEQLSFF
jgi:type I restriction enzyme M protein